VPKAPITSPRAHELLLGVARFGLAALFLYTGALKAIDPTLFAQEIANYRLLPEALVGPAALLLPALELAAGVALLSPRYRAGGALLTGVMLLAFSGGMAQARLRGIDLDCGCFGAAISSQVSWDKVAIDMGLAILSFWIVRSELVGARDALDGPGPDPELETP